MLDSRYQVRFNVFKPTDRSDEFWHGYIFETVSRRQQKWNTHERVKRDALQRVKERIDQIYGSGETLDSTMTRAEPLTVERILQKYQDEYDTHLSLSGKSQDKKRKLKANKKHLAKRINAHLGPRSVYSLNKNIINDYIKARKEEDAAESTIKLECETLKTAVTKCLPNSKAAQVKAEMKGHIKLKATPRKGFIPQPEFERLVEALPEYMRLIVKLLHFTGARPGEIRALEWRNVKFETSRLEFDRR